MTTTSSSSQSRQASDFMATSSSSPYMDNNNSGVNRLIGAAGDVGGVGYAKKKPSEPAKFPCNKCSKVFTRKSHLTRHKMTHDQVKIYCDCGRLFRQKAHLHAHLPACKRKREAIEAKYLAETQGHLSSSSPSSMVVNVRRSSTPPSPPSQGDDVTFRDDEAIMNYEDISNDNNNTSCRDNKDRGDQQHQHQQQQQQQQQQQLQNHVENDNEEEPHRLPFNLKNLPVGLPPLIRDPI